MFFLATTKTLYEEFLKDKGIQNKFEQSARKDTEPIFSTSEFLYFLFCMIYFLNHRSKSALMAALSFNEEFPIMKRLRMCLERK